MSFIYGGNTGVTYDQLQRKRDIADRLSAQSNAPRNVGEGLVAVGNALRARRMNKQANEIQDKIVSRYGVDNPVVQKLLGLPAYRRGTPYHGGGAALVGEDGPEIVALPQGAQVLPAAQSQDPAYVNEFMGLSPEERAKVIQSISQGLPAQEAIAPNGYDPREMIQPQSAMQQPYRVADSGEIATDALPYGDAKLTEGQSKDVGYFARGTAANTALSDPKMEQALTQWTDSFAGNFGAVGRAFQDAEYQQAKRAADEYLAVILRKDTGAAVTKQEFDLYGPMYLPMPGDKPELIEAKRKAREIALNGIEMGLGTAGKLGQVAKEKYGPQDMSDDEYLKSLGLE